MLRALAVAALLTPAAVDTTIPEREPPIMLRPGDVICVGYEPQSHSCLVKRTITRSDAGGIASLEEMRLTDFGTPLKLTTLTTSIRRGERYCLAPSTTRAVVVPEIHHAAALLTVATVQGLNRYAAAGFCLEHRPCGNRHVAIAHAGETRFPEEDMLYTLFRESDPRSADLTARTMAITELDAIKGFAPVVCLPTP